MQDLTPHFQMVDNIIRSFGVDPQLTRTERPGQWALIRGSARVWIDIWHIETEGRAYFQAMSPVVMFPAPALQPQFFQELLEINDKLFGVGFTIFNGWAWLKHIRELDGMDQNEATAIINRIGIYADQYDDYLRQKYGEHIPVTDGVPGGPGAPGGN